MEGKDEGVEDKDEDEMMMMTIMKTLDLEHSWDSFFYHLRITPNSHNLYLLSQAETTP